MADEQPQRYFLRHPAVPYLLIATGLLLFALTTYSFLGQRFLHHYDGILVQRLTALRETSPPWLRDVAYVADKFGSVGTAILGTLFGLYWLVRHRLRKYYMLLLSLAAGFILFLLLAFLFDRARPGPINFLGMSVRLPSYPSGHMIDVVAFYSVLLYLYLPRLRSVAWRLAIVVVALLFFALVGFLRLYEGAHYFTDIVGGFSIGTAWAAFALLLVERNMPRSQPD